ncbi:unnamed protein product, partial [Polarella glacialis]
AAGDDGGFSPAVGSSKVPVLPRLTGAVSPPASELCSSLLRVEPRRRPLADMATDHEWFEQCEAIQRAHRTQSPKMASKGGPRPLTAPMPQDFWVNLRFTFG